MNVTTSTIDSVIVVWHVAVNAGDAESAVSACTEDVVMDGPNGPAEGRDAMREWVERAGIHLRPRESYDIPGGLVVAQDITWPGQGEQREPERFYTAFGLRDGEIASVKRYETLEEAGVVAA